MISPRAVFHQGPGAVQDRVRRMSENLDEDDPGAGAREGVGIMVKTIEEG